MIAATTAAPVEGEPAVGEPAVADTAPWRSILVAADSSDHALQAATDAVGIARAFAARLTGVHVYAAALHDRRFRQMEGGLPQEYHAEAILQKQRDTHDDLITRGLSTISRSHLGHADKLCAEAQVPFTPRNLEGKNYRQLVDEANRGAHDLLVLGARGLGALGDRKLGAVCRRVSRYVRIDTLVVRRPGRSLADGPIVVGIDGSDRSFGALLTALSLGRALSVPVQAVAAFDPLFHYAAFKRIAGVLDEEARRVFQFEKQEALHEEIIDSGLARIYESHLTIARSIASDHGVELQTHLLAGRPAAVVLQHLRSLDPQPSLLVAGRLGVHADAGLDIGGNAEEWLAEAPCSVLLSEREHRPAVDVVAEATMTWTREAEACIGRAPAFARGMARMAVMRHAAERGHTVITENIVRAATERFMAQRPDDETTQGCPYHAGSKADDGSNGAGK